MAEDYQIYLNFLAVERPLPTVTVYRKRRDLTGDDRPEALVKAYKLPIASRNEEEWPSFWISPTAIAGFEPFEAQADWNREMTRWFLFLGLRQAVTSRLKPEQFYLPDREFIEEVSFVMHQHEKGQETLVVQPYFLSVERLFGFLADFHFQLAKGVPFDRKIQQLSGSLDEHGRRNLDYYVFRVAKIKTFLSQRWDVLSSILMPGASEPLRLNNDFFPLRAERLRSKVYVFAGERESKSQFLGLKQYGPLRAIDGPAKLLFVFREQDRQAARTLAVSLRGWKTREGFAFPGFQALFLRTRWRSSLGGRQSLKRRTPTSSTPTNSASVR